MQREPDMADEPRTFSPNLSIDPHSVGEPDNPQLEWGEPAGEATFGSNHSRRPIKTEAERGRGAKTRTRSKDIISRR